MPILLVLLSSCVAPPDPSASTNGEAGDDANGHDSRLFAAERPTASARTIRGEIFGGASDASCSGPPERVVESMGFREITLSFPQIDVDEQVALDGSVCLQGAIRRALDSLLTETSDDESPLSLIVDLLDDESAAQAALADYLNRSSTRLALVPRVWRDEAGVYLPENGESVETNWVFFMTVGDLSDHLFWAIVPRDGGAVTNYGFN